MRRKTRQGGRSLHAVRTVSVPQLTRFVSGSATRSLPLRLQACNTCVEPRHFVSNGPPGAQFCRSVAPSSLASFSSIPVIGRADRAPGGLVPWYRPPFQTAEPTPRETLTSLAVVTLLSVTTSLHFLLLGLHDSEGFCARGVHYYRCGIDWDCDVVGAGSIRIRDTERAGRRT
jgi:hypothetical protein